ncbi:MAG: hypothetical protein HC904_05110 [Blastochloris sp.]|nr:hypothetical protein [Blastochloris sp.]
MIKTALYFFLTILGAAVLSSLLGGLFGMTLALISPDFITDLFSKESGDPIVRYSFSIGMVWGLFIGAAVAGFSCGLSVVLKVIRIWIDLNKKPSP